MTITNYWILIIWVFAAGALLWFVFPRYQIEGNAGLTDERWYWLPALILVIPIILWAAKRGNVGDTNVYRNMIKELPLNVSEWKGYVDTVTKDKGFTWLMLVINLIARNNSDIALGILATIQLIVVALVFRKYSSDYGMSIIIFVASCDLISWVWNGSRQFTAVVVIFAATRFIVDKKYIPAIIMILVAATLHQSALLMLPVIFIIQGRPWNIKTVVCVLAAVVALVFVNQFTSLLDKLLADTQYTNVVSDYEALNDNGTNPLRVLVYSVPTLLSIVGYRTIRAANEPYINVAVNASIVSSALYLISMGTSGIYLGRLPIYVSLYATGILLPWELNHVFSSNCRKFVKAGTYILYTFYFYYQMHSWGFL